MSLNPMFQNKKTKPLIIIEEKNVRNSVSRKTRTDKKSDVKVPVTAEQKKTLRIEARNKEMKVTPFSSYIVKKGLIRAIPFPLPIVPYPSNSDVIVHVKLEKGYSDMLDDWCIEWDCSRREATYRVLFGLIEAERSHLHE